jgi:hypothetical protein
MTIGDLTGSSSSGAARVVRRHSGRAEERSRNDEALACAREFMATVGCETHRDRANAAATNAPDPAALAGLLGTRQFDQAAVLVAAWCALLARCEGSDASYQTWK